MQTASSEGARYAAANPTASDDTVAAYVREACALGDTASVTVTSADAPSKPVTLKSGDKSRHVSVTVFVPVVNSTQGIQHNQPGTVAEFDYVSTLLVIHHVHELAHDGLDS